MGFFNFDEMTREKFKGNSMCHFEISKEEVNDNDLERVNTFFEELREYGTIPRQKVFFAFGGYDDDKRELIHIIEVVRYIKAMLTRNPWFWYYATPFNSEIFYLALLVDENNYVIADFPLARKFSLKMDPDKMKSLIYTMGANLNMFGEDIGDIDGSLESLKVWSAKMLENISQ